MKSALAFIDKEKGKVYHVIVSESIPNLKAYIDKFDTKTDYKIIENWELAQESIKFSKKYGYQTIP